MKVTHNSLTETDKPMALEFPIELENWNLEMLIFEEGGKPENPVNNLRGKVENQQQTQPTYEVGFGNQTQDPLVGGKRSYHCAIPAPLPLHYCLQISYTLI